MGREERLGRGRGGLSQEAAPRPASGVPGNAAALHGGHGGLRQRPLLGREIAKLGHTVKLISPAYVKPFVKRQKNDMADAEAICEAAQRPTMRFVALKSANQQAAAVVFRTRDLLVRQRTQAINALRGHLTEFGVIAAKGPVHTSKLIAALAAVLL